jgi:hypothetical protein
MGRESEGPRRPGCSRFSAPRPLFAWRLFRTSYLVESFNPLPHDPVLGVSRMSPPQSSGELGGRRRVAGWVAVGTSLTVVIALLVAAGRQYCRKEWGAT